METKVKVTFVRRKEVDWGKFSVTINGVETGGSYSLNSENYDFDLNVIPDGIDIDDIHEQVMMGIEDFLYVEDIKNSVYNSKLADLTKKAIDNGYFDGVYVMDEGILQELAEVVAEFNSIEIPS